MTIIWGCSQSNVTREGTKPPKKYPLIEKVDSNFVLAAVKPENYEWNQNGNLADVIRNKYKPPTTGPYPNPFSPPSYIFFAIMESDSIKFFICNENESSCYKFQEGYFEKGYYSLGFQKLNMPVFVFKIETPETTYSQKYIYLP